MAGTVTVRVEHLTKAFGGLAVLADVSFEVREGEICCLIGPSGSGKTTTFNLLAGLDVPSGGRILIDGRPPGSGISIGYMFQDLRLLRWRTVLDNVAFGLKARGVGRAERERVALRALALLGLEEFRDAYPHRLSGGMQQRVALARAFAVDPAILLMDEPFKSLDAQLRLYLLDLVVQLWRTTGKTILFITHDTQEAARLGHQIIVYTRRPVRVKAVLRCDRPPDTRALVDPDVVDLEHRLLALLQDEGVGTYDWIRGQDEDVRRVLRDLRVEPPA
jgi:NitT/TauT family transport system ATP-binding protein